MNLSIYATLFKLSPFGKDAIISALRNTAEEIIKAGNKKDMDEACSSLVAAGFFSLDIGNFKGAAAVADQLHTIYEWYNIHQGSVAQRMRAHGNALLLRTAVRIFQHQIDDLTKYYDDLQKDLSLVIVEGAKYGKRWKLAQLQAGQLQLYLDWLVLGSKSVQTWRTAQAVSLSEFGNEQLATADSLWFKHAQPGWESFINNVRAIAHDKKIGFTKHIKSLRS